MPRQRLNRVREQHVTLARHGWRSWSAVCRLGNCRWSVVGLESAQAAVDRWQVHFEGEHDGQE